MTFYYDTIDKLNLFLTIKNNSYKWHNFLVARNTFLTYARKRQPILLEEQNLDLNQSPYQNDPEETFLQKEKADKIRKIMMALNENERTILLLRDYEGLSYEEIATILNFGTEVVKSRLFRARKKYRKLYEAREDSFD